MKRKVLSFAFAAMLLASGCATKQSISVTTEPAGASVTIVRIIEKGKTQDAAGIPTKENISYYEERPQQLGSAPIDDWTFKPYWEGWVRVGLYRWRFIKHCKSVRVQAEKDGMAAEETVSFDADNNPVKVHLTLQQGKKLTPWTDPKAKGKTEESE